MLEHLSRNPNNHTLSRGDAVSKDTEHPNFHISHVQIPGPMMEISSPNVCSL